MRKRYYEFFAGGGMARLGLGKDWKCTFANDLDTTKAKAYSDNFHGAKELVLGDVGGLSTSDLPGQADLAWASFPCQDLSLAGAGQGLRGERSGTFFPFWELIRGLEREDRAPRLVVLENVYGILTSRSGRDFARVGESLAQVGYRFGAVVIDAIDFVPQSRPRVFIVAVRKSLPIPRDLLSEGPTARWHPKALLGAWAALDSKSAEHWLWWDLPRPPRRRTRLSDLLDEVPTGVEWHSTAETKRLLDLMSERNLEKVRAAKRTGERLVGCVYRRTRVDEMGEKRQRAEIRFDNVAGCLRTPAGGSSRQTILVVQGASVRSRLLSPREAARLMGLPDTYKLPVNNNAAYHLVGDGVVVPVVRHVRRSILDGVMGLPSLVEQLNHA